jgi:hypothetical protein
MKLLYFFFSCSTILLTGSVVRAQENNLRSDDAQQIDSAAVYTNESSRQAQPVVVERETRTIHEKEYLDELKEEADLTHEEAREAKRIEKKKREEAKAARKAYKAERKAQHARKRADKLARKAEGD